MNHASRKPVENLKQDDHIYTCTEDWSHEFNRLNKDEQLLIIIFFILFFVIDVIEFETSLYEICYSEGDLEENDHSLLMPS